MDNRTSKINVENVKAGMILGQNIYDNNGNILLSKGIKIRDSYLKKIKDLGIDEILIVNEEKDNSCSNYCRTMYHDNSHKKIIFEKTRREAKDFIEKTMKKIYFDNNIDVERLKSIVSNILDNLLSNDEVIISLENLRKVDDYTFEHSVNVCILSLVIGISLGYSYDELLDLGIGAILHDIGKMMVPKEILNKPGPLTAEEYDIVKKHTIYGYEIIKKNSLISEIAAQVVLSHHERPDGCGYPQGKSLDDMHCYSKIVAIADVYDALTSNRTYKSKVDAYEALEYIRTMAGSQFDKEIVKEFIKCIGIYPVGSIVRLNTNEVGLVVDINKFKPNKPIVRILIGNDGRKVTDYIEVDINKNPDVAITSLIHEYKL
ncbi:HD-GYP domain-containing protein [Caminicella sporogenes]|uniref:HD-GYP domain-containing protein n=1 Tax=Caminicella sporogenes TaxID=166485 RepID=UPI0025415921|nr:HD-GYP domain-containing protein [Caminicella sporogenes]WIF95236.1 HD-GYP domain-containing protein [Caminicella sporogenes]